MRIRGETHAVILCGAVVWMCVLVGVSTLVALAHPGDYAISAFAALLLSALTVIFARHFAEWVYDFNAHPSSPS